MRRQALLKVSLLLLLPMLLQACGFHLRGMAETSNTALPGGIGPVYVQGLSRGDFLLQKLEELFVGNDTGIATSAEQATSRLRITARDSDRRVLAVDSNGKVIEYELKETVSFSFLDSAGNIRVPDQSVMLLQSYINPEQQVLGGEQEEKTLRQDMWRRMADQILRRLAAQLR